MEIDKNSVLHPKISDLKKYLREGDFKAEFHVLFFPDSWIPKKHSNVCLAYLWYNLVNLYGRCIRKYTSRIEYLGFLFEFAL